MPEWICFVVGGCLGIAIGAGCALWAMILDEKEMRKRFDMTYAFLDEKVRQLKREVEELEMDLLRGEEDDK